MPSERSSAGQRSRTRRSVLRTLGAAGAVGALTVAGCSNPLSRGGPTPDWRRDLSKASAASPPAVGDDTLLVGGQDKQLHALDGADGTRAFTYETGGPIETRPVAPDDDGRSHVRSTDGDVYAVDASGDRLWSHESITERGDLARAGSLLVEDVPRYEDPAIRGFDAATGDVRFALPTSHYLLPGLTAAGFALPVPTDGDRTRITVFSLADGTVRWETDPLPSYVGVAADEELVVTYHDGTATAYAISDGTRRWRRTLDDVEWQGGPYLGAQVYFTYEADDTEGVLALDRADGTVRWQQQTGYQVRHVEPSGDAVFVGTWVDDPDGGTAGRLDCFESDGTRRWQTVSSAPDVSDIAVIDETVLLAADRALVALDRSTGDTRWTHEPDGGSRIGLVTDESAVYVSYLDAGAVAKFSMS